MAKEVAFIDGTVVSSKFLNDVQQGLTGASWGGYMAPHASDPTKLALTPGGHESLAPIVMSSVTGDINDGFLVGFKSGTQNSSAASGSAGTRNIWVSTTSALQLSTAGDYVLSINEVGSDPSNAFQRKLGTATWNGTNLLTNVRLLNGVMANADQKNSFIFRTVMDAAGDIPLTLAGRNGQSASSTKMLSVGYDVANVYGEKWSLSSTGLVKTKQAASTDPHYQAFVTTDAQPQMSLLGSATGGVIQLGVGGSTAVDVTIARSAVGVVKVTDTVDVINIQNSTASGALAGGVNVLDALNVVGSLYLSGTLIASTHLSDTALLARLASPTFSGVPAGPTAAPGTNTTQLASTAFVTAALAAGGSADASTTVKGITKMSVAPVSASSPISVGDNDARVTADQAAGTASIRTLGTGATQAAAGNHTHAFSDVTGTITAGQYAAGSIVNADINASAAIAYSKLALTGSVLNADLAGSIAYSKLSLTGAILNADLAGSIAYSKLSLTGAILNADLAGSIAYSKLSLTGAILNADLAGSIVYSKLSLTGGIVNADINASAAIAYSKLALTGGIVNADVNASAAIAYSKLALTGAILNADLAGSIAYSKLSLTGAILNADLAGSIAYSKLSLTGAILNADLAGSIAYSKLTLTGAILNADVSASAAIVYSKLSLTGGIVNADVNSSAAIAYSKLSLTGGVVNADVNASAAIAYSKLALTGGIVNADVSGSAAIAYSKLALTGAILNADLAGSIAYAKLSSPVGSFAMNSQKFTGLAAGTTNGDSVRYDELTSGLALKANLATPSLTGTVGMTGYLDYVTPLSTTSIIQTTIAADSFSRLKIRTDGQTTWGGGALTGDVVLSRSSAGTLLIAKAGAASRAALQITDAPVAGDDLANKTYVDLKAPLAAPTFSGIVTLSTTGVGGNIVLGNDTVSNLYRSAASTVKTDGAFIAVGAITTSGDLVTAGAAASDNSAANSPKVILRGYYDADASGIVTSTAYDMYLKNVVSYNAAAGSGVLNIYNNANTSLLALASTGSLTLSTAGVAGNIVLGNDSVANLYRSAASTMKTDGAFIAVGAISGAALTGTSLTVGSGALTAGATSVTTFAASSTSTFSGATTHSNVDAILAGAAATNGSFTASPKLILRGFYDSDSTAGTTSTAYNMYLKNTAAYNAASGSGSLAFYNNADTALLTLASSGSLTLATTGVAGNIVLGADSVANLYRSTASTVKTDGAFIAVGALTGASLSVGSGALTAGATSITTLATSSTSTFSGATTHSNVDAILAGTAATNGSFAPSPKLILRGFYDSDSSGGTTSTAYDMYLKNTAAYNAAAGAGRFGVFNNAGTEYFTVGSDGYVNLPQSTTAGKGLAFASSADATLYNTANGIKATGDLYVTNILTAGAEAFGVSNAGTVVITSPVTAAVTDKYIGVDSNAAGAAVTVNLPDAAVGKSFVVFDQSGHAADTSRNITVAIPSGHYLEGTIDGTYVLNIPYESVQIIKTTTGSAAKWVII